MDPQQKMPSSDRGFPGLLLLLVVIAIHGTVFAEDKRPDISGMILLEAGCFQMGSEEQVSEEPVHAVCVTAFYLDKFEVAQKNFESVMKFNPSAIKGHDLPVVNVSWIDADGYCRKKGGRLPSEAEWEYAVRAGTTTPYFWGNDMDGDFAWFQENLHAVGKKKPNPWGFHDMSGNVWEWVADWYREDFYEMSARADPDTNPQGPAVGQFLLIRGGSYKDDAFFLRSASRFWYEPVIEADDIGFRCAADPMEQLE